MNLFSGINKKESFSNKIGTTALQKVINSFSWENNKNKYLNVYKESIIRKSK